MATTLFERFHTLTARLSAVARLPSRSASCIGLDVGSGSIKGVLLTVSQGKVELLRWAFEPIPPESKTLKSNFIRSALNGLGQKDALIVTGIGGPGTVLRSVLLPEMSDQELKAALSFEAEKYIPFKLDETYFDSYKIGKRTGGRMEILLAAARKEVVESHLQTLASAEITPDVVDLEALALANAWERSESARRLAEKVVVLIHVGVRGSLLNFFHGKNLQFTREIPIGGDAFTRAVAEGLSLDPAEAEKIKCEPGKQLAQVRSTLEPVWDDLLSQGRVSFDFFENQFGHKVEQLMISGGSAGLAGFKEKILQSMGLPTDEWNPAVDLSLEGVSKELGMLGPTFAVAIGLALRGMGP
ncbi:MAG: type IV pilus assembly protein PilM [Candidatus Omnitrophica bacterium]|nr:type IV pilus assembly protein PilM [Candidatus Omnitrophota bacterium]